VSSIDIGGRRLGQDAPCWIGAEVSANHNHSFERAAAIVRAAAHAGADAVKLQTYTPDTLTIDCDREWFKVPGRTPWEGRRLYELYSEAFTPWEWHAKLRDIARGAGLEFFSTPFDDSAVEFLESRGVNLYKVASFEAIDIPLLRKIASTGKPVIASTGMASLAEIEELVRTLRDHGTRNLVLLKCTSAYPARPEEMNLRTIPHLAATFGVVAGLSDHTMGSSVAVAAVALGARVIEKHFTLRRADGGPDSSFSMEPDEFAAMVRDIRNAEAALGDVRYQLTGEEARSLVFRRSLFVVKNVARGEPFTPDNVRVIRPGHGLHPRHLAEVLGRRASADIARGTPLDWGLLEGAPES
jgi:N-acetylneuraminate synthase